MNYKWVGVGLIVLGFVVAIVSGGWLAGRAAQPDTLAGDLVAPAILVFIPVAVLVGSGIYLYQRRDATPDPVSEVQQQRQLVDLVNEKGRISIDELAAALQTSPHIVQGLIEQLLVLEIFSGEVDWENGIIYAQDRRE